MLPWKTVIEIRRDSKTPLFIQITKAIIREISYGRLKAGQALPGSRSLSELIGVNRKTSIIAYEELMAQGWIEILPSKGTFVAKDLPVVTYHALNGESKHAAYPEKTCFPVKPWVAATTVYQRHASMIALDDGSPDTRLAPLDIIWRNCRSLTRGPFKNKLLAYGDLQGDPRFREVLAEYLSNTRGLACQKEHVMITRGSIMALHLVLNQIVNPGDVVLVGETNYPAANSIILNCGGSLQTIPVDENGISTHHVEEVCKKIKVTAIYITPHHHFPTTVTLSAERRLHLLELSQKHQFAILEDDYDYDFHYASGPILPLASFDRQGSVIYMGSFSKLLAPGIRIGYLVAPQNLIQALNQARRHLDRQGDFVLERALSQLILDGDLQRHLKKSLKAYRIRRNLFCQTLKKRCLEFVNFNPPEGGMAIWTKFNSSLDLKNLSENLASKGVYLDVDREILRQHHATRLGFASLNETEIVTAVEILGDCLERASLETH